MRVLHVHVTPRFARDGELSMLVSVEIAILSQLIAE